MEPSVLPLSATTTSASMPWRPDCVLDLVNAAGEGFGFVQARQNHAELGEK